jgi:hypothetical protein
VIVIGLKKFLTVKEKITTKAIAMQSNMPFLLNINCENLCILPAFAFIFYYLCG